MKDKRGGIGKGIIWIIIILVIIGLIALAFNYLGSDDGTSHQGDGQQQGSNDQDNKGSNVIDQNDLGEKPPRPPE